MFLDKLKKYFRLRDVAEPIKPEYLSPRNEYYGKVSERFGTAQMLLYVVLTVFVLVSLMINSEWVTYENFYYFFSDMGDYITSSDSEIEDVIYSVDRRQSFSMYGGKFAVAGNSGLKLYTASGRLIINDDDGISNPKLEASDRYLMMYDSGNTEFRIYNIFTETFSANTAFPIYGADLSDSGDFAIITGDSTHSSAVHLYSSKFKLRKTYKRNDFTVDVALNSSGNRIALLSYYFDGSEIVTKICMLRTDRDDPYAEIDLNSSFPLYCEFTDSNRLVVVCDNKIAAYEESGKLINEYEFEDDAKTVYTDINGAGVAAIIKNKEKYFLTVFDRNGKQVYNNILSGAAEAVSLYDSYVFVDSDISIKRINTANGEVKDIENNDFDAVLLAKSENEILLCLPTRVKYINFE